MKVWPFSLFVEYGYNFNSDLSGLIRSTLEQKKGKSFVILYKYVIFLLIGCFNMHNTQPYIFQKGKIEYEWNSTSILYYEHARTLYQ